MPVIKAALYAWNKKLCIVTKKNKYRLTLTGKNKGQRPGNFTIIEAKASKLKK